ncbi:MAG: hypothetical protein LBB87_02875 [Nitrososphaerota archaeon]|nr:hypothetical protein [Nitrososphaerota archaeon]
MLIQLLLIIGVACLVYRFVLSELFECRLVGSESFAFLSLFRKFVQWWLDQAVGSYRSYDDLRDSFYGKWRVDWKGYSSQHAQTSSLIAYGMLKSSNQPSVKENLSFAVISPSIVKLEEGGRLVFPIGLAKKACVQLVPKTTMQQVLLEQALNGYWKLGQTFLTDKWCAIPFTRYLDLTKDEKDSLIQKLLK